MDGPNVNWKMLDDFKKQYQPNSDSKKLIEIGSCGLHVAHGAFQTGHKCADWNINGFLRSLHNIFKESPARRQDYADITESDKFPLKFVGHRWLENVPVVERALEILPNVRKYVDQIAPKPTSSSFATVAEMLQDKFLVSICYTFVRRLSCLVPIRMLEKPDVAKQRFEGCVDELLNANRLSTSESDRSCQQFEELLFSQEMQSKLKQLNDTTLRLDDLFTNLIGKLDHYADLFKCIKMLLLISHGNASVESGFSVNEDLLVENLKNRSVVAQRTVYDSVKQLGGVLSVDVDKKMILSYRKAHSYYSEHLEKVKAENRKKQKEEEERKEAERKLKTLEDNKRRMQQDLDDNDTEIVNLKKIARKK